MLRFRPFLDYIFWITVGLLVGLSIVAPPACYPIFTDLKEPALEKFSGFSFPLMLVYAATYAATAWFGFELTAPFWRLVPSAPRFLKYLAAFFIGYVCVLGPLRVLTLVLPYNNIYAPGIVLLLVSSALLHWSQRQPKAVATPSPPDLPQKSWRTVGMVLLLCVLWISASGVHIRQWDYSFNGHGYTQYAYLLDDWRADPPSHFPIITRHYDELLYNYFLTSPLPAVPSLLVWWFTLMLVKLSMFAFLALIFAKLGASWWLSIVSAIFMFIGSTSLLPTKYYMLFDASNLLFFTVHCGRMVGIGLILFLIIESVWAVEQKIFLPLVFFGLSGLGLAATSISNAVWALVITILVGIYAAYHTHRQALPSPIRKPSAGTAICYGAVLVCLVLYSLDFNTSFAYTLRMVVVSGIVLVILTRLLTRLPTAIAGMIFMKPLWTRIGILVGYVVFGLLFLGNLLINNPLGRPFIKKISSLSGGLNIQNLPLVKGGEVLVEKGTWAIGDHRELGQFNEYCKGLIQFVDYYGLVLVMILLTHYLFRRAQQEHKKLPIKDFVLYEIFLIMTAALPVCLFFTDFVDYGTRAWFKTRFMEVPVYSIIFVCLYFIGRAASQRQKILLSALLLVYAVVPFLATQRPQQILHNYKSFLESSRP